MNNVVTWLSIVFWVLAFILIMILLITAIRNGRPCRRLFSSATLGLCALGAVNLLGGLTGVSVGFSWLAVGSSMLLGIPGVVGMVVLDVVLR